MKINNLHIVWAKLFMYAICQCLQFDLLYEYLNHPYELSNYR